MSTAVFRRLAGAVLATAIALSACRPLPGHASLESLSRAVPTRTPRLLRASSPQDISTALELPRASGRYLVEQVGTSPEGLHALAIVLRDEGGDSLTLLIDYPRDLAPPFPIAAGESVFLRYATRLTMDEDGRMLALLDDDERLRLLFVRRPPDTDPWPEERALPGALTVTPGIARVYVETLRLSSYCLCELVHLAVDVAAPDMPPIRLAPGEWTSAVASESAFAIFLAEHQRLGSCACPAPPPSVLCYLLVSDNGE